jgi:tRNA-specific 2-thiouridylase
MGLKPADTPDSQEICFVPNDDYRELIQIRLPELSQKLSGGDIVYHDKKIGSHKGYPYYTIGQRRGLNVSIGRRIYVSGIDPENNKVIVDDESGLFNSGFTANEINLMMFDKIESPLKAKVKIRYNDKGNEALIEQTGDDSIRVTFDSPQKAITPGQSAVFYSGNDLIGGGIIDKVF